MSFASSSRYLIKIFRGAQQMVLRGAVKLSESELGITLKNLVERSLVRTTASKNITQALFGLAERVDPEIEVKSAFRNWNS